MLESDFKGRKTRADREKTPLTGEDLFIEEIMPVKIPRNFKRPDMGFFYGTTDPRHHLSNFKSRTYMADTSDATRCIAFPTMLTKAAMKWFDSLPPRVVTCFDDLGKSFLTRFSIQKDKVKHAPSFLGVKQKVGEFQRVYMEIQQSMLGDSWPTYRNSHHETSQ
ncbi:hypothetical protein AHAS_Ahas12G0115500 [Arachis hypogaea]